MRNNKIYITLYIFLFASFIFSSVIFFYYYKYQISPDTVEYIQIALKYSSGNFNEVINGYRSPLFSILLVPFIKVGMEPLFSTKILNIILGFILLIILQKTAKLLKIDSNISIIISFFSIPMLMFCIFSYMTPDLLSAIFIILAFNLIIDNELNYKKKKGILFGAVIGFGYLAKAFNLPFLIAILTLTTLVELFIKKEKIKDIMTIYIISIGVALAISAPWVILVSLKYHKLTFSEVGILSYFLIGPDTKIVKEITTHLHPINSKTGFILDDFAIFIEELKGWFDINFLIKNSLINIKSTFKFLDEIYLSFFSIVFLIVYKRKDYIISFKIYSFFLLYIFGYSLFVYADRYLYPLIFLGFFICISILSNLKKNFYKLFFYILIILISYSFLSFSIDYLRNNTQSRPGLQYYNMGQEVKKININGNIAASSSGRTVMYITYYNRENCRYFGTTKTLKELDEYNIDYYFVYKDDLEIIKQLETNQENKIGHIADFHIYELE